MTRKKIRRRALATLGLLAALGSAASAEPTASTSAATAPADASAFVFATPPTATTTANTTTNASAPAPATQSAFKFTPLPASVFAPLPEPPPLPPPPPAPKPVPSPALPTPEPAHPAPPAAPVKSMPSSRPAIVLAPATVKSSAQIPFVFSSGRGQFDIVATQADAAQRALTLAGGVWRALAKPLALPKGGFSSPVIVKLVPAAEWPAPEVFSVVAEPGGVVSARVRWGGGDDAGNVRRALVQTLILRRAVSWYGATDALTVPLWLEQACLELSDVAERPSLFDALQQKSAGLAPPRLEDVLRWQRGPGGEASTLKLASFWLLEYLLDQADAPAGWTDCLHSMTGGMDPVFALDRAYGRQWPNLQSRELWWQVGFYNESRASSLPGMSAEDTRDWLADRCRWLAVHHGREQVMSFDDLWASRRAIWTRVELVRRDNEIMNRLDRLHPFYRNAAIALGAMYQAALANKERAFKSAESELMTDAVQGRQLENATDAALDALEAGAGRGAPATFNLQR